MVKPFIWAGLVVLAIGVVVGVCYVVPHIGQPPTTGLNGVTENVLSPLAVVVAAVGLALGSTLLGVGVGRWQHPKSARPTQTQHGAEV